MYSVHRYKKFNKLENCGPAQALRSQAERPGKLKHESVGRGTDERQDQLGLVRGWAAAALSPLCALPITEMGLVPVPKQ
ncbi:hypothetical protein M0657_000699 [Pyricularia oryzae]|uniref:Uncharacterized protein n=2 Tax=Pyricularia oryzae TaxID=318829 RepID=A0AA97NSP6_PYRO3|nr:hypothetical protein OOU_Y34scaffold00703g33 [Pyricularia oryzae Y34]KAI7926957.1 hypothetical protein M9X92_002445 [Pyricularia oryzae]KAI7932260.1 hypothetical protein M0657_000699 [Pyricularia oryzae]